MAGTIALEDVLGVAPLTEALRVTTSGIPDPLPAELSVVKPQNRFLGDRARYRRIQGARTTAKLAAYGAAGRRVPLQPIGQQDVRMLFISMEFFIDVNMLNRLTSFESYNQDEGLDFVREQIAQLGKRIKNTEIVCKTSMLRYGAIYWDADGNILPSASGASYTISAQVPGTHQNQINGIISTSWALVNTDIFGQIRAIQFDSIEATGMRQKNAGYGINIPKYFQTNSTLQSYFVRNAGFRDKLVETGEIPEGFGGIKNWWPAWEAFFEDQNGTNQALWDGDLVVMTPDMGGPEAKMDWWAMMHGSAAVLRDLGAHADALGALKNCPQEYGESGWAIPTFTAPIGVQVTLQHCFLPIIKSEKAPYQIDTVF